MTTMDNPADIIAILKDIERRSQQRIAGLSQQDNMEGAWTAIGFRLDYLHLLIPLSQSREVFPLPQQITPVPKSQPWVVGMTSLRGDLLPLIDLNLFLQGSSSPPDKRKRVIVLNHPEFFSGLIVDEVFGLKHFQRQPEPADARQHLHLKPYLQGRLYQQETYWHVFSLLKLAEDPRFLNAAA